MLITRKFEETSNNQLSVVTSAFDDLCVILAERNSVNCLQHIWQRLMSEFGTNMHLLVRLLPNVLRLAPSDSAALMIDGGNDNEGGVNFFSLCDNIQRFMRVISSSSCPVFLFLDDLQVSNCADKLTMYKFNTYSHDCVSFCSGQIRSVLGLFTLCLLIGRVLVVSSLLGATGTTRSSRITSYLAFMRNYLRLMSR